VEQFPRPPLSHWLTTIAFVCALALVIAWHITRTSALGSAAWVAWIVAFAGVVYNRPYYRAFKEQLRSAKQEARAARRASRGTRK
jgi:hypothetical protein